jgi:hypothetical protein
MDLLKFVPGSYSEVYLTTLDGNQVIDIKVEKITDTVKAEEFTDTVKVEEVTDIVKVEEIADTIKVEEITDTVKVEEISDIEDEEDDQEPITFPVIKAEHEVSCVSVHY